jgi:hypothetical protein
LTGNSGVSLGPITGVLGTDVPALA